MIFVFEFIESATLVEEPQAVMQDPITDTTTRALKAKIQILTQDLTLLQSTFAQKDTLHKVLEEKFNEMDLDKSKMISTLKTLQVQFEKYKRMNVDLKSKNSGLEAEVGGLRKEVEGFVAKIKQGDTDSGSRDVK